MRFARFGIAQWTAPLLIWLTRPTTPSQEVRDLTRTRLRASRGGHEINHRDPRFDAQTPREAPQPIAGTESMMYPGGECRPARLQGVGHRRRVPTLSRPVRARSSERGQDNVWAGTWESWSVPEGGPAVTTSV